LAAHESGGVALAEDAEDTLAADDEGSTAEAVACLAETARQLREMADYLLDLAKTPIEDGRTRH
jgi:hypothetical protein